MELFTDKNNCCGCTACKNICPKNSITMVMDSEGFLYPQIDEKLCVNCGMCKKVCAFQNGYNKNNIIKAYGLKHKNFETRFSSRSGGAFILISDYILEKGGTVYGAAFNEDFTVSHKRAENKSERDAFKGSKYVQSEQGDTYANIKADLKAGKYVMYSGTACQVAGLYGYLKSSNVDCERLYTVDLVCHGVPSNKIWKEFLLNVQKKNKGSKITNADFRDKTFGWNTHFESVWVDDKKVSSKTFAALFYRNDILRPSCFECKYTNINRPADYTLADFWGVDKQLSDFNDNKGVSLFLVSSQKGMELFEQVKDSADYREVQIENCTKANPNLRRQTEKPDDRDVFWQTYYQKGFDKTLSIYNRKIFISKLKKKLLKK